MPLTGETFTKNIDQVSKSLLENSSVISQLEDILRILREMTSADYGYIGRLTIMKTHISIKNKSGKVIEILTAGVKNTTVEYVGYHNAMIISDTKQSPGYSGNVCIIPVSFCGEYCGQIALGGISVDLDFINGMSVFYGIIGSLIFKLETQKDKDRLLDDREMMRTKNMFMANVSHEIRTPLNSIIGSIDYLSELNLPKHGLETLDIMRQSSWNLLTLVNDILDLSGLESGKIEIVLTSARIADIITTGYNITKSQQKSGVEFVQQINSDVPETLILDQQRVKQILINLLSNAFKFTESGRVKVEVSLASPDDITEMNLIALDCVNLTPKSSDMLKKGKKIYLKIAVSDTGIGIKQDDTRKLFKSFSQIDSSTTKRYQGTGLGLAISQGLCHLMQGEINLVSKYGVGSSFYFVLPVQEYANTRVEMDKSMLSGISVLIVDDKVENIMRLTQILDQYNVDYVTCTSAKHAVVSYINNSRYTFDLGLIDIFMPDMDGNELGVYIAKSNRAFPLIALSSSGSYVNDVSCVFDYILTKPYTENQLITSIYNIIKSKSSGKRKSQKPSKQRSRNSSEHAIALQQNIMDKVVNDNVGINILIVEDHEFNQLTIKKLLNCLGYYNITIASSGPEAIRLVKKAVSKSSYRKSQKGPNFKFAERCGYDVIFMDIVMPEMSGIEASKRIIDLFERRSLCPKIIAVTANVMEGDRESCINMGKMDDYIAKPINKQVLAEMLGKIHKK